MKSKQPFSPFEDARYRKVLGFLTAKGFLYAPKVKPLKRTKIEVRDAIWVGENLEPRVLEVLPAAMLRFPATFVSKSKLPDDLARVLEAFKHIPHEIPDFRGFSGKSIKMWADKPINDARAKTTDERKYLRSFRLSQKSILILAQESERRGVSNTAVLEDLLANIG